MNFTLRLIASATVVGLLALHVPWCGLGLIAGAPGVLNPGETAGGGSCCCAHGVEEGAPADTGGSPDGDPCCPGGCKSCPRTCCGGVPLAASPAASNPSIAIGDGAHGAVTLRESHLQSITAAGIFHPPRV